MRQALKIKLYCICVCTPVPRILTQEGLLPFQTERSSGSGEETASAQGGWRSGTAAPGAPCAMTPGAWQRPRWCVSSWAVARPWKLCRPRHLVLEMRASGWMRCGAGAGSPPCGTVLRSPGVRVTASIPDSAFSPPGKEAHEPSRPQPAGGEGVFLGSL